MTFKFKKQPLGFMDMLRFKKMTENRLKIMQNSKAEAIPEAYEVNEKAKALHPGKMKMRLVEILNEGVDTKSFIFEGIDGKPAYFRAGQYITVGANVKNSKVTRPYSLSSSPKEALKGKYMITIKRDGFFSNYMLDNSKIGDIYEIDEPSGEFYFQRLRDLDNVVAVAGGSGITPFYSMAKAISEGSENFNLTIFYGVRNKNEIIFKNQLDALKSDKVKVIYVLSDSEEDGYEKGFITRELMKKYVSEPFTLFACGPNAMYEFLKKEVEDIPIKHKHFEDNCVKNRHGDNEIFRLKVHIREKIYEIDANSNETLLVAMERAGIEAPNRCRSGSCGFCHSKLVSGDFTIAVEDKRRLADSKFGYIHPCCTYPESDIEIIVPKV